MSAIFGIINKKGNAVDSSMTAKMQECLIHRAVDGQNIYSADGVMFGHHKLIVHRRQTNEQLPLVKDDLIITCDARIDNSEELINQLNVYSGGTSITDAEIIIEAYKKWGNDCVNYLEGEFTFAIWDKINERFYAASDHIGFRTFYYYQNKEIFAFASEIKALEAIKTEPLELNEEIFFNHYTNVRLPITYDKNINVIQSGHYITLLKGNLTLRRYWSAKKIGKYKFKNEQDWYDEVLKLVTSKIECMIDTDSPVGILLSGGLDSSFIASVACKILKEKKQKLIAFSSVLPLDYMGKDKDERFYIEKLKNRFDNLEVHYIDIPPETGPYSDLYKAFDRVETSVNSLFYVEATLFEAARKYNVRTLLTGFGGDMTISYNGNGVIYHYLSKFRLKKAFNLFVKRYRFENYSLSSLFKMEILGQNPIYRKIRDTIKVNKDHQYYPLKKEMSERLIKEASIPNRKIFFIDRLNSGEIGTLILNFRKHSNAFDIEFLSPLLDKKLIDLFFDIPEEQHLLNGIKRSLIKQTMKNMVPAEILNRNDKLPFAPDYNRRIAKIRSINLEHLYNNKKSIENDTGIDFEMLHQMISKISQKEITSSWLINKEIFFIPIIITVAEFKLWLKRKKQLS